MPLQQHCDYIILISCVSGLKKVWKETDLFTMTTFWLKNKILLQKHQLHQKSKLFGSNIKKNNYCYWWFQNWSGQHKSIKRIHGTSNRRGNSFGNIKWWLFKKFQRCKKKENIASWKFLFFQTSCLSPFFLLTQNLHHIEIPPVKSHANLFLTNLHGLRSAVSGIFKLSTSLTESKCFIIYSI